MNILGINLGSTSFGKSLKDGGACLLIDDEIAVSIAEERLTRKKSDGGFAKSVPYCLDTAGLKLADIDQVVYSTCCEPESETTLDGFEDTETTRSVSHHLSHAHNAFCLSPFEETIVIVIDAGGNTLSTESEHRWWACQREQASYFIAGSDGIDLLHRDFEKPFSAGLGEVYRAFTHFLGFGSYVYSGKTMGLAAFGNPNKFDQDLFLLENGRIKSLIDNDPPNPIRMVERFAESYDLKFGPKREAGDPINQSHMDVARYVQDQLEEILIEKVNYLIEHNSVTNLAYSGGVALNCVANSKILKKTSIDGMFIPPAAGDQGQCVGNVLYGHHNYRDDYSVASRVKPFPWVNPYLGRRYDLDEGNIKKIIRKANSRMELLTSSNVMKDTTDLLIDGNVVGWFQGGSEHGPRALGNRSLLADPRQESALEQLNAIKNRLPFRPFAPSILEDYVDEWFSDYWLNDRCMPEEYLSPLMLVVGEVRADKRGQIPTVVHSDGTSRLQAVNQKMNERYFELIETFHDATDIPLLLNTSLNRADEPLCETRHDAINLLGNTELQYLVLGNNILYSS